MKSLDAHIYENELGSFLFNIIEKKKIASGIDAILSNLINKKIRYFVLCERFFTYYNTFLQPMCSITGVLYISST